MLTASADSVDEGDTVTFTVEGGKANFTYNYELTGVDATDVEGGVLTGSVTTDADGNGTFEVTLAADRATDGADTLTATLPNTGLSASVTVNDTSLDNVAPVAEDAAIATTEAGAAVDGQLVATDAEGDALTFELVAAVEGLTLNADGSYTFDPAANTAAQALTYTDQPLVIAAAYTVTDALGAVSETKTLSITVEPTPLTIELVADASFVEEGSEIAYTLVASEAIQGEDITGTIQILPGDGTSGQTDAADFGSGSFNPQTVTIAVGATTSDAATITPTNDAAAELPESYTASATVEGFEIADLAGEVRDPSSVGGLGQTFTLTTGVDTIPGLVGSAGSTGTDGNDTIVANYDGQANNPTHSLGALDNLNGGLGTDTLEITSDDNLTYTMAAATISNIENITIAGAAGVTADVSGANVTGLESLAVTKATAATLTADSSTAVSVSGVTGITTTTGGASVTIDQDTSAQVGSNNASDDTIASIVVNKAKDVDVTVTNSEANAYSDADPETDVDAGIVVGDSAANAATGTVNITATGAKTDGDDATLDAITVTGGTTVSVTQVASADMTEAEKDTDGATHTLGAVDINAGEATTSVTVVQDEEVGETNAKVAKAGVVEQQTVKFVALKDGESVTIDGLTFTASADLTAAQVAEAFAGLEKGGDLQDAGGPIANGIYTGALDTNWVSGEANGDTVVFSQAVAGTGTFDGNSDTAAAGNITVTKTQTAVTAVAGVTGVLGVVNGAVTIDDNGATASVTDVVVDGYGAGATLGGTNSMDALENLTLRNSGIAGTASVTTTQTALNLTVEDVDAAVTVSNTVKDLTLTAENVASSFALNTTAVENATINANADLTLSGTALAGSTSAQSVTVNGSGEVVLGDISTNTGLNTFNASANTGGVSATIETDADALTGSLTEYVFSAGDDTITLDKTDIDVKVTAGAGDDSVILADGTTAAAKAVDGGAGDDKLQMLTANAVTASQNATFAGQVTNFETLVLRDSTGAQEVEADVLGNYNKVEILNAQAGSATTVDGLTSGATIILNDNTNVETIAAITDADTNTADVLNINIGASDEDSTADANGIVRADDVETVNIDVTDISTVQTPIDTAADAQSITLNAQDATTINVTGNTDLTLSTSLNQKVTAINASTFTGNLTVTAAGGVATTITGGSGDDVLKASTGATGTVNAAGTSAVITNDAVSGADGVTNEEVTVALTDGTTNAGLSVGDTMALTVDGTTFTYTATAATETMDDAATELAALIDAGTHSAAYDANTDTITITSARQETANLSVTGYTVTDAAAGQQKGDIINGGAGDDTITGGDLAQLTGGEGNDTFIINKPTNVNSYSTIIDLSAGDVIDLDVTNTGTVEFTASAVTLASTAVFQDYANAAVNALDTDGNDAAWFQYDGNTYIVQSGNGTAGNDFVNGEDSIIQITGLVDLSTASYNQQFGTLEIA